MIKPFSDDANAVTIGDLVVENGAASVVISGALQVTRDRMGLRQAQKLQEVADALVEALQAIDLPDRLERLDDDEEYVANPFR